MHGRMADNVKTVYPPQTKFAGGIINFCIVMKHRSLDLKSNALTMRDIRLTSDFSTS